MSASEVAVFMRDLMLGKLNDEQIAEFLLSLKQRGETVEEIVAAVRVMRENMKRVEPKAKDLLDTCGTGGDGRGTFNVSTLVALVAAACGVVVAKHGNRAISGASGSADLLKVWGLAVPMTPERVAECIDTTGFGFMFAPDFHPGMRHAASARQKMKQRTLFNCLGPMTNPAGAKRQLIGVYDKALARPVAEALGALGSEHVIVVHGEDGLDEVSLTGPTDVCEMTRGKIESYRVAPEDYGLKRVALEELKCADAADSARIAESVIGGRQSAALDFLLLNAGFALKAAEKATDVKQGMAMARHAIETGAVVRKIMQVRVFCQSK